MRGWFFLLLCFPSLAFAGERSVSAGLTLSHFDYNEDLPAGQQSHESGWIPLLDLASRVAFAPQWEWLVDFQGTYKAQSKFEGSTNTAGTFAEDTDNQTILRGETGFRFYPVDNFRFYGGVAISRWERLLNYGTGYRETYTWSSVVLGVGLQMARQAGWDLWADAALLPMLSANLQVNFSDYIAGGEDANLTLGNRVGSRIRITWQDEFRPGLVLSLAPFFERSEFSGTDSVPNSTPLLGGSIREPDSRTEQYGLATGLSLTF